MKENKQTISLSDYIFKLVLKLTVIAFLLVLFLKISSSFPGVLGITYLSFVCIFAIFFLLPSKSPAKFILLIVFCSLVISTLLREPISPGNGEVTRLPSKGLLLNVNRVLPEELIVSIMYKIVPLIGLVTKSETEGLQVAINERYQEMEKAEEKFSSPLIGSILSTNTRNGFDTLFFCKDKCRTTKSKSAVIFLHGFGGNWSLPCYEVARAANKASMPAYCPSFDWAGNWASSEGQEMIKSLIEILKQKNIENIHLAGLSNGAIGISILRPLDTSIKSMTLLFGSSSEIKTKTLPMLFIYGDKDWRFPAVYIENLAKDMENVTIQKLSGDHFTIIKNPEDIQKPLAKWFLSFSKLSEKFNS